MIEQGFNCADSTIREMTYFFETRVENLEHKDDRKKSSAASKKSKKTLKKSKREDSDSSVVESSKKSTKACHPTRKYCILHRKCSHSTDNCNYLRAMVKKYKQRKKKPFKNYVKNNKALNALIEKNSRNFWRTRKGGKQRKNYNIFKKCRFQTMKAKRVSQALQRV